MEQTRKNVRNMGIDDAGLSDQACYLLMQPFDAPENYYCDGQISRAAAKKRWVSEVERTCGKKIATIARKLV